VDFEITGPIFEWRGPAPFFFVAANEEDSADLTDLATGLSYGWGCIPVTAHLGAVTFTTSLMPKDGSYLVPLKKATRELANVGLGDVVRIGIELPKG
jgi:hypothetical protein